MPKKIPRGPKLPNRPEPKRIHTPVTISYRYAEPGGAFCLSFCERPDVRAATNCLKQLTTLTWQQALETGGRLGNKSGLGLTHYDDDVLNKVSRPPWLAEGVKLSAVRPSRSFRIFGVHIDHVFYVIWFDPNYDIISA